MLPNSPDAWTDFIRETLGAYEEPLLRRVAAKLCKPRSQWPVEELIVRCLEVFTNPPTLDRRLKELDPAARQLLAAIGHSRQPCWSIGNLIEIATVLGTGDGLATLQTLLDAGLIFPVLASKFRLRQFEMWLSQATPPLILAPPAVTERACGEPLPLTCPGAVELGGPGHEADGLDWLLRLAVLWQQLAGGPLRRTQNGDFFKRDLDRLRGDALLGSMPADALTEIPDPGLFSAALGQACGVVAGRDGELSLGAFSPAWSQNLPSVIVELLASLPRLQGWNSVRGWDPSAAVGNPFPSAQLLTLLALANLPEGAWAAPEDLEVWLLGRHPYWMNSSRAEVATTPRHAAEKKAPIDPTGVTRFLLGIAYPLKLCQACKNPKGGWAVRLSPLGRWALGFQATPPELVAFPQTLLVQPNLEILVYRQGLTPELLVKLTRFATWRTLGAACTMQLEAQSVYRALESGESHASVVQCLERHGMKPTPAPVLDAIKTWANKRDRITVYPAAVLLEFSTSAELNEALSRGLPAVRLTEKLAAVASDSQIDYKHFRIIGNRDYCVPPEPCVEVEGDGVTLSIDLARSDLLLESELQRFAELQASNTTPGRRVYRMTPTSVAVARQQGWSLSALTSWFTQRTGLPISPAARLLFSGVELPAAGLRKLLVLQVASEEAADGLMQWPGTAALFPARLGPTALVVQEADAPTLQERLRELGIRVVHDES